MMRRDFGKTVSLGSLAAASLVVSSTALGAATLGPLPQGDFNFGARSIDNSGSTIAVQAVREVREDGEYLACVMSGFKDGRATAIPGVLFDQGAIDGTPTLDVIETLQHAIVDRSSYRIDAAYIVVSISPEGEDFVRINVGAPQQEGAAELFIDGQQVDPEHIIYEYSARAGHPDRPEESYAVRIDHPETIDQIQAALSSGLEVTMVARSVNSDFVLPSTYQSTHYQTGEPVDISAAFNAGCLDVIEDMDIALGTFPSWGIGNALSADIGDILRLANMLEDENALANPGDYQMASVLWTQGMFAIGPHALQQMMNGEIITTSMGEYISENHQTGVISVSPDVLEFFDNDFNSCSCITEFLWPTPDTPYFGGGRPPVTTAGFPPTGLFGGGVPGIITFGGGGTTTTIVTTPETPAPVPLPPAGLLLVGAIGGLFRRKIVNSDLAISSQMFAGAALSVIGNRLQGHDANMPDDLSRGEVFVPQSV